MSNINNDNKKYLMAQEVAERLAISFKTVYSLAKQGCLRSYKFGRLVRFDPDDVDDYIKKSLQEPKLKPKAPAPAEPQNDPGVTA